MSYIFKCLQVIKNYDNTIGKNAGECLWNQRKNIKKVIDRMWAEMNKPDLKAKVLMENIPCILFDLDRPKEIKISVKERHRLEQIKRKFIQSYLKSASKDFDFIKQLKTNETLESSKQNTLSYEKISNALDDCIESTTSFIVIKSLNHKNRLKIA